MQDKNALAQGQTTTPDSRLMGYAMVLQTVPKGVWYSLLTFGFIIIGTILWYLRNNIENIAITIASMISIVIVIAFVAHIVKNVYRGYVGYHNASKMSLERQVAREKLELARLQNERLRVAINMDRYMPTMMQVGLAQGRNITYSKGAIKIEHHLSNLHSLQSGQELELIEAPSSLPTQVRYEDIRHQIPQGHVLVGIGPNGVETKESAVGACVWIVGLSGTGKTSTTVLRVEERAATGHKFLAIDPHWFKPDSLSNAISGYAERFVQPPARDSKEALAVLTLFLDEFNGRKSGRIPQPWQPMTLLVDEVNALMDAQSEEEKQIKELLPTVARVCGQEARNFLMGGIFISQQATLLAWLRKVALMIIVHQLLMESEKKLALNGDTEVIESMKTWPVGRTYVYGVGFQEGPRTVQQPYFAKEGKGEWAYKEVEQSNEGHEPLPFPVARKQNKRAEHVDLAEAIDYWNEVHDETGRVPTVKEIEARYQLTNHQARRLINEYILPEAVNE